MTPGFKYNESYEVHVCVGSLVLISSSQVEQGLKPVLHDIECRQGKGSFKMVSVLWFALIER
jgi:hypothetical protein